MRAAGAGIVLALLAAACGGPRPRIVSFAHRPGPGAGSVVEVVVENAGGGEGQAMVEVTARSPAGAVRRAQREVALRAHEQVTVLVPLDVPADDSHRLAVAARYPVD